VTTDPLDTAVNRLARNMAITQVALSTTPPAVLFELNIEALLSSVQDVQRLLGDVPHNRIITSSSQVMGPHLAEAMGEVIQFHSPTPDTVPTDWRT
jgi:hypothetical protein